MIARSRGLFSTAVSRRKSSISSRRRSARRETTFGSRSAAPTLNRSAPILKPVVSSALIAVRDASDVCRDRQARLAIPIHEHQERVYDPDIALSIKSEVDPILTLFRASSYIRIRYTPN